MTDQTLIRDALRDECEAHRIAAEAADRFRDVLCEVLDLGENPGDDELVALIRKVHGKSGPEPRRWRDFITGAKAHLERNGLRWKSDAALNETEESA